MSRNPKEKAAARALQAHLNCSYTAALQQVRSAEEARRRGLLEFPVAPPEVGAALEAAGWTTLYVGPTVNHAEVRARLGGGVSEEGSLGLREEPGELPPGNRRRSGG